MTEKSMDETNLMAELETYATSLGIELSELECPNFSDRFISWAFYLPEKLQVIWPQLSLESRLIASIIANNLRDTDNSMAW